MARITIKKAKRQTIEVLYGNFLSAAASRGVKDKAVVLVHFSQEIWKHWVGLRLLADLFAVVGFFFIFHRSGLH